MAKITVDKAKCDGCGKCTEVCPVNVFELKGKKSVPVRANDCIGCKACEVSCPKGAIKVES